MRELLEKIIWLIPTYIENFLALVSGPKRFVANLVARRELSVEKGLVFLGLSFGVSWIITTSHRLDLKELYAEAAFVLTYVGAYGAAICLAWRLVGGRAILQQVFAVHFYYSGIIKIVITTTFLVMMGLIRSDPHLYKKVNDAASSGTWFTFLRENEEWLVTNVNVRLAVVFLFVGLGTGAVWMFVGWGAYRELNGSTRLRSAIAASLFTMSCVPVMAVTYVIANAIV